MNNTTIDHNFLEHITRMDFTGLIYPPSNYFVELDLNLKGRNSEVFSPDASSTLDERQRAFENLLERLEVISSEEDEDDFTYQPSEFALILVCEIVEAGYLLSSGNIIRPLIAADGQGGLKFDWRTPNKEVRLFIPASDTRTPYLYYREGVVDNIIENPDGEILANWLTWLNE